MAVTDLTNTMWIINETPSYSPFSGIETLLDITFTSNNQTFTYVDFSSVKAFYIYYGSTTAYTSSSGWTNTAYRTILITGGNDVTNATLIAWLQANAVQQELYSKEYKYYPKADLTAIADAIRSVKGTSTTYTIDQMIETLAGGGKVTDLSGTSWYFNDSVDTYSQSVGLTLADGTRVSVIPGSITFMTGGIPPTPIEVYINDAWISESYRTWTNITTSITDSAIIDWFYENATLQS